jgi:prephenate dehydrogenase
MDHLVVGAGEMGRWFGATVGGELAFADLDPAAAREAADATGGRAVDLDDPGEFDLVTVAVPLPAAVEAIESHGPLARRAVADVTGRMVEPVAAMERAAPDREHLSLHPLFAASNAPGNVAVAAADGGEVTEDVRTALVAAGNGLVDVAPAEHDDAMCTVQGRAHAAILAFGLAAEEVPAGLETPVYEALAELLEQVTGGTPRVYADVQAAFGGAEEVADAAARIAAADREEFAALYEDAR